MRYLKYAILLFMVILLPVVIRDEFGFGTAWFCKYLCPLGAFYSFLQNVGEKDMTFGELMEKAKII